MQQGQQFYHPQIQPMHMDHFNNQFVPKHLHPVKACSVNDFTGSILAADRFRRQQSDKRSSSNLNDTTRHKHISTDTTHNHIPSQSTSSSIKKQATYDSYQEALLNKKRSSSEQITNNNHNQQSITYERSVDIQNVLFIKKPINNDLLVEKEISILKEIKSKATDKPKTPITVNSTLVGVVPTSDDNALLLSSSSTSSTSSSSSLQQNSINISNNESTTTKKSGRSDKEEYVNSSTLLEIPISIQLESDFNNKPNKPSIKHRYKTELTPITSVASMDQSVSSSVSFDAIKKQTTNTTNTTSMSSPSESSASLSSPSQNYQSSIDIEIYNPPVQQQHQQAPSLVIMPRASRKKEKVYFQIATCNDPCVSIKEIPAVKTETLPNNNVKVIEF